MVCGCRAVDGGSCTHHLSRHRWRNRHCPSLPPPLLPCALDTSWDLSLPHFPPPLCPALPKEEIKRFIPYTQLNLCGLLHLPWWFGRPQTTLRTLLTDLTILVQHLSCSLHGWNFQPESSKILKDDKQRHCWNSSLLRVNITVELLSLIYHIAIHIDRELFWTLTLTSLKAFGLNGYFISPTKGKLSLDC